MNLEKTSYFSEGPEHYDFLPKTYVLPEDTEELQNAMENSARLKFYENLNISNTSYKVQTSLGVENELFVGFLQNYFQANDCEATKLVLWDWHQVNQQNR